MSEIFPRQISSIFLNKSYQIHEKIYIYLFIYLILFYNNI